MYSNKMTKIGFDFGKTIGEVENENPYKGCYNILKMIVDKLGSENVYIISKARVEMKLQIQEWLVSTDFYSLTGFDIKNLYFVDEYADKRSLVDKLKINIFVDDSIKVIRYLYDSPHITKLVWLNGNTLLLKEIPRKYRNKISIPNNWNKLYKITNFF